jgi:hypothetical protein
VCSFSPCIEQVQKTAQEMTQLGFTNIYTIELLRRILCVKKFAMANFDFNMDLREKEPIAKSSKNEDSLPEDKNNSDKKEDGNSESTPTKEKVDQQLNKKKELARKKRNIDSVGGNEEKMETTDNNNDNGNDNNDDDDDQEEDDYLNKDGNIVNRYAAKAINLQPGHTGFLTFATLLHKDYLKAG